MKNFSQFGSFLFLGAMVLAIAAPEASRDVVSLHKSAAPAGQYGWIKVIPARRGCWPDCSEGEWCWPQACGRFGQWPMTLMPVMARDKLWMIANKSTWSSTDGLRWQHFPSNASWGERYGMEVGFFNDKFWKMGGMQTWDNFKNDVWSSNDGVDWKMEAAHAPWSPRRGHSVIVFHNQLWLLGGAESSGHRDQVPTKILSDVWSSSDGSHWLKVTDESPWAGNDNVVVFRDRIWSLGPKGVWSSPDGKAWTKELSSSSWMNRSASGCLVFDGKIWWFGGMMKHGTVNDAWSSEDGIHWTRSTAPWSPRGGEYSIVFRNRVWIYGGKTGRQEDGFNSEVWCLQKR